MAIIQEIDPHQVWLVPFSLNFMMELSYNECIFFCLGQNLGR